MGNAGLVYYKDAYGAAGKDGNYALIKDFKKGDKISLVCDEMGEYSILACDMGETIGICSCIYYNNDDQTGAHIDLIACVTGPDALRLDLMDASTFIWDITPSAIDSAGAPTNDILFLSSTPAPFGAAGSDVLHGSQGEDRFVGVDPASSFPGRGEVDVLIGLPGADTFVLGGLGRVYYVDPLGQSARSYAAIQDFEKGDKIVLVCDEMGEYSLQNCTVGLSEATCIYYDRDGIAGVGLTDELIAMVQGPDALRLDLMDASTFIWDIPGSAIDATGSATNDILIGTDAADKLIGKAGSDVIIGAMGNDQLIGVNQSDPIPGRGEVDVLIGAPGADTFVLGASGLTYYLDPIGLSSNSYAAIQDFENGDKIFLTGNKAEYVLLDCLIGVSPATCIYFNRDGVPGVGAQDDLIAAVQGPASQKLDLTSNSFIWDSRVASNTTLNIEPLLDGLSTIGKRLAYFVYDTPTDGSAPLATAFTYDPIKKAGAQFFDLDGKDGAETVRLKFIDGGYGDKDGIKNGVIVDPSTPVAIFTATTNSLSVGDPTDSTSPAAIIVKASISSRANSVNQVGYVALNSSEDWEHLEENTRTYDLLRDRGTILMSNLESSDAPSISALKLENNIALINGQKLVFFEIVDTTLEALMAKGSTIDSFGSNFRILDVSETTDTTAIASKGGNTLALSLQPDSVVASLGDLISTEMGEKIIFDFTALAGRALTGSVSLAREASYDSSIGFYRIQRNDGAVLDPITNTLITPGSTGYKEAALSAFNLFTNFGNLSISNGANRTDTLAEFSDAGMLAPYATVAQTGETFFSFKGANSDGMNHFRMLGSGVIGLEDVAGGFDQDFDDNILSFNFKLK
ncbi:choice-of-anchor U domain-containing protein [Synechococcus sp. UW140]|uniref:choice-of-anchor U domain-containing protein n=1 Tax=Synechococcus sp. UW140 TaxID=368503 RepID=UPI00313780D6